MLTSQSAAIAILASSLGTAAVWSQAYPLTGTVRDGEGKTPIAGAQVCHGPNVLGISGADGRYSVVVHDHGKVAIVYKQIGYADRPDDVIVNGATQHDTELYKKTNRAEYWQKIAKGVHADAMKKNDLEAYKMAWTKIDASGLTPEAKAEAARQLIQVLPASVKAPATLQAYTTTDQNKIDANAKVIDEALTTTDRLKLVNVPAPVAADIAADKVTEFEKTTNTKVQEKFYQDFNQTFGNDASERLKTEVKAKENTTPAAVPPV